MSILINGNQHKRGKSARFEDFSQRLDFMDVVNEQKMRDEKEVEGSNPRNDDILTDATESAADPPTSKRFNEFIGKRSTSHDVSASENEGQICLDRITFSEVMHRLCHRILEDAWDHTRIALSKLLYNLIRKRRPYNFIGKRYNILRKRNPDYLNKRFPYPFINKRSPDFLILTSRSPRGDQKATLCHNNKSSEMPVDPHKNDQLGKIITEFQNGRKRTEETQLLDNQRFEEFLRDNFFMKRLSKILLGQNLPKQYPEFIGR